MARKTAILILIASSLLVYGNTLFNSFIWDDYELVLEDPLVKNDNLAGLFSASYFTNAKKEERGRFRPLRIATFIIDHMLYGENPWGYHLTNILLHTANVVLIYIAAVMILKSSVAAFIAALLFAVHPVHVESIAWVKNRSDVICLMFFLLAIIATINDNFKYKTPVVFGCFIAGFLSKEIAIMMPLCLLLLVALYYKDRDQRKKALLGLISLAVFAGGLVIFKEIMYKQEIFASTSIIIDAYTQMRLIIYTLGTYVNLLTIPFGYSIEHAIDMNLTAFETIKPLFLIIVGLGVFFIMKRKDESYVPYLFSYGFMIITIMPVSNIIFLESRPIAEQRMYIPSFGYCMMVGKAAEVLISNRVGIMALTCAGLLISTITFKRNLVWRDDFSFWHQAVEDNPSHYRANSNLGILYYKNKNYKEAVKYLEVSALHADRPDVHYYLGVSYDNIGRYQDSLKHYFLSAKLGVQPFPDLYNNVGIVFDKLKRYDKAKDAYKEALRIQPNFAQAVFNLADLCAKQDNRQEAKRLYNEFIRNSKDQDAVLTAYDKLRELEKND